MKKIITIMWVCLIVLVGASAQAAVTGTTGDIVHEGQMPVGLDLTTGVTESDVKISVWDERQNIILPADVDIDINDTGTYTRSDSPTPGTIAAGTVVNSYILHFDEDGGQELVLSGSITFDRPILGLIMKTRPPTSLTASDSILGIATTTYDPGGVTSPHNVRGLETFDTISSLQDEFTLSADRLTVTVNLKTQNGIDEMRIVTEGLVFCSFTQGFWGNEGGKACDGTTTRTLIAGCVPITVGMPGNSITLKTADCVIDLLPAGGKPAVLPEGDFTCPGTLPDDVLKKGNKGKGKGSDKPQRFNNVLIGQVVALTLNLCVSDGCLGDDSDDLGSWVLPDEFCTVPYYDPEACPIQYTIPGPLVGKTVQELLDAANAALAGNTTYSISDIYTAVTAINEGFDECRTLVACPTEADDEICDNGCDDDDDGLVDGDDPDCEI